MIIEDGVLIKYYDDPNVTRLTIPSGVKMIGDYAFYCRDSLEEITIPEGVTGIGENAFAHCHGLKKITMADSVRKMGRMVFKNCQKLESVKLSASLRTIPANAFEDCEALESIVLPDRISNIRDSAFINCIRLTNVQLPKNLRKMGKSVFFGDIQLKQLEFPDGMPDLNGGALLFTGVRNVYFDGMRIHFFYTDRSPYGDGFLFITPWETLGSLREYIDSISKGCIPDNGFRTDERYPFILASFTKYRTPETRVLIKNRIANILTYAIASGEAVHIAALIEEGLVPKRSIDRYIALASKLGHNEIYLMLVRYKEDIGGYGGRGSRFKL